MTLGRTLLRLLTIVSAAFAISVVPVARAYAEIVAPLSADASFSPVRHPGAPARPAHRVPHVKKPKQSSNVLSPDSHQSLSSDASSSRRRVPLRERVPRARSFALLPDHPPA